MPCKHTMDKHVTWNLQQEKERSGSIDPRAPTKSHPTPGGGGGGWTPTHPEILPDPPPHPPPPWGRTDIKQNPGSDPKVSPPPKECWAMVREHKTRSAQSAERNVARQWPTRP